MKAVKEWTCCQCGKKWNISWKWQWLGHAFSAPAPTLGDNTHDVIASSTLHTQLRTLQGLPGSRFGEIHCQDLQEWWDHINTLNLGWRRSFANKPNLDTSFFWVLIIPASKWQQIESKGRISMDSLGSWTFFLQESLLQLVSVTLPSPSMLRSPWKMLCCCMKPAADQG